MAYLTDSDEYTTLTGHTLSTSTYPKLADFDTLNSTFSDLLNLRHFKTTDFTNTTIIRICKLIVAHWIFKLGKSERANIVYRSPNLAAQSFAMEVDPVIEEWDKQISMYEYLSNLTNALGGG